MGTELSILTWNIRNPSLERAKKLSSWLLGRKEDIWVLTEIKDSKGCSFLKDYFILRGFNIIFPNINGNDYGTMLVSKFPISFEGVDQFSFESSRFVLGKVKFYQKFFNLIGIYVPSRDRSEQKIKRKRDFIEFFKNAFQEYQSNFPMIVCGDLNVLDPLHYPRYPIFRDWEYDFYSFFESVGMVDAWKLLNDDKIEYSWVGRTGNGYRYDYFFIDESLNESLVECRYIHEPRKNNLSDHSALYIKLNVK